MSDDLFPNVFEKQLWDIVFPGEKGFLNRQDFHEKLFFRLKEWRVESAFGYLTIEAGKSLLKTFLKLGVSSNETSTKPL